MTTTMTYGSYNFSPVPMVTVGKEYLRSDDGTALGTLFNFGLDGTLTPRPTGIGGIGNTYPYTEDLRDAFNQDGCPFVIECNGSVLWSGHPRVMNLSFAESADNWVETIPYSIDLQFDVESNDEDSDLQPPHIQSANESWSLEFLEDNAKFSWDLPTCGADMNPYVLSMTHSVSAKGIKNLTGCSTYDKEAWEEAKDYVVSKLSTGADAAFYEHLAETGVMNLSVEDFTSYNHARTVNKEVDAGMFSVTETWLVMDSGAGIPGNALEDFTITTNKAIDNGMTAVTVEGSIQGVETRDYGSDSGDFLVSETKYQAASGYWAIVKTRLPCRATLIHTNFVAGENNIRALNSAEVSRQIGHSPTKGVITYSYTYDDRPSNCITGAYTEMITVIDNNKTDVFAEIAVLGRQAGPVLQDVNTVTATTREVHIELITPPAEGCTAALLQTIPNNVAADVVTLLTGFQDELTTAYDQVFKHLDTESWSPKDGRYNRQVGWTYQSCS